MSQIHISKEVFEKLKESKQDSDVAMLMSKFNPERVEAPKYKNFKTKRKMERIHEVRKTGAFKKDDKDRMLYENGEITLDEFRGLLVKPEEELPTDEIVEQEGNTEVVE